MLPDARNGPPRERERPGATTTPGLSEKSGSPHHLDQVHSNALTDAQLLALAYARGYKLAARCIVCGHWICAEPVPLDHIGPTCRRRLDAQTEAS